MNRKEAALLAALLLGCTAMSPGCSSQGADCEPHARRACSGGVLYWVDACGRQEENIRICPRGCAPSGDACLDEPDGEPEEADGGWDDGGLPPVDGDDGGAPDEGLPEGDDGGGTEDDGGLFPDDGGPVEDDGGPEHDDGGAGPDDADPAQDDGGPGADDGSVLPDDGGPEPDDGAEPAIAIQTVFSVRPADNGRDYAVEDAIVDLIQRAVPGSRIRVAIYTFTRDRVADELVAAHLRGVDVKVLLDGGAPDVLGSEVGTLQTGLGMDRVHLCDAPGTSCLGTGIMHHKTFLFSELSDGSRNVVLQASHNLTNIQLNLHNNAVIVRNDDRLFESYQQTFEDMWQDVENNTYYHYDNGSGPARVYYFPKGSGSDPVVSILNSVACDATSRIRVLSAFFTDARLAVAQALAARQADGCDVAVVASTAENNLGASVQSALTAGGVTLVPYPERTGGWTIHSKILLIDAPFEGSAGHRRLVFCGSHNWTGPALWSNDETMLRIEDDGVFQAFLDDWARTRAAADRP